ncbi:MAG: transporter substrate-binding domain-containing protein [Bauldia sp.]
MAMAASPASAQNAAVTIPNFWDPAARTLRPPPGTVTGIRFVTTDDFPPFNFVDAADRLTGFNVDLARAICEEIDVPCSIQARPFEDLVPSIVEGRADAAIGGIAISPETRALLAFSDVYLRMPARFATRNGLPLEISAEALAGRRVSVVAGSAHQAFLEAFFPTLQARAYPTAEAARSALRYGQTDATFGDGIQLAFWLQGTASAGCCRFAGGPYLDAAFFGDGMAIAIRPTDRDLQTMINSALASLQARGLYAELYLRYFPLGFF